MGFVGKVLKTSLTKDKEEEQQKLLSGTEEEYACPVQIVP